MRLFQQTVNKILFIRTDRIGDTLMSLAAIRTLRINFPKAWIAVCVDHVVAPILEGHPDVDEVMAIDAASFDKNFFKTWRWAVALKKIGFNLAVVSNPKKEFHLALFLAGIPVRVGYKRKWGFLLTRRLRDEKTIVKKHETQWGLELVKLCCEKPWDGQMTLPVSQDSRAKLQAWMAEKSLKPIVAVHPGTTNPRKKLRIEIFAELCGKILDAGDFCPVIIGGPEERQTGETLLRMCRPGAENLAGQLSLKELTAFLSHPRVHALVTGDSGPMHVASIMGKPCVAIFAKGVEGSDPERWGPLDLKSQIIYKPLEEVDAQEIYSLLKRIP